VDDDKNMKKCEKMERPQCTVETWSITCVTGRCRPVTECSNEVCCRAKPHYKTRPISGP